MHNLDRQLVIDDMDTIIDSLISEEQYTYSDSEKESILLPIIKSQLETHYQNNVHIQSWIQQRS